MIRLLLIGLAILYLSLPVHAQTVQVRSGEHEDFSRLTLALPERVAWSIEPTEAGADIVFAGDSLRVDPGAIFDRIPRTRLTDARWNAGRRRLELAFDCDCAVDAFWFGDALLVLDIRGDGGRQPQASDMAQDAAFVLSERSSGARALALLTPFPDPEEEATAGALAFAPVPEDGRVLDEARNRLLKQVSRATSQGLLKPSQSLPKPANDLTPPGPGSPTVTAEPRGLPPEPDPLANLRVNSRIDLDYLGGRNTSEQRIPQSGCLADVAVDVPAWGSAAAFGAQVAALRLQLTGEFGEVDPIIAEQLARLYIFFGFGAEAKDILNLLPRDDGARDVLRAMSEIAENGFAPSGSVLANQLDCDSPVAVWSALSYETLPRDVVVDADAIVRGFNALPAHLRAYYGPILARRFLETPRPDVAARLLRILDRGDAIPSPEAEMARAEAELANGAAGPATDRLEEVMDSNAEVSSEALIALVHSRLKQGEAVSSEEADLAGAFAFERRNEPDADVHYAAHIRALAGSGAFDLARKEYRQQKERIEPALLPGLQADLARFLEERADDIDFLRHALSGSFDHAQQPDASVANAIAKRLIDLGFPEHASALVGADLAPGSDVFLQRQLLRAEIALSMNRPRKALVELLDLEGARANLIRASALAKAGDHSAAATLYEAVGATEAARRAAFFEGAWADPALSPELRPTDSAENTATLGDTRRTETPLKIQRDLADASRAAREALVQLLDANQLPAE